MNGALKAPRFLNNDQRRDRDELLAALRGAVSLVGNQPRRPVFTPAGQDPVESPRQPCLACHVIQPALPDVPGGLHLDGCAVPAWNELIARVQLHVMEDSARLMAWEERQRAKHAQRLGGRA